MSLFRKSKKVTSCCKVEFEEIKIDKKKKDSCCHIKIEEVTTDTKFSQGNENFSN